MQQLFFTLLIVFLSLTYSPPKLSSLTCIVKIEKYFFMSATGRDKDQLLLFLFFSVFNGCFAKNHNVLVLSIVLEFIIQSYIFKIGNTGVSYTIR